MSQDKLSRVWGTEREDWFLRSQDLYKQAKAERRRMPKRPPSAQLQVINQTIAEIEDPRRVRSWTQSLRNELASLKQERRALMQEERGRTLLERLEWYCSSRWSNWNTGLDESMRAMAEDIAERAHQEGRQLPPEILVDFPKLVAGTPTAALVEEPA